MNKVYIIFPLIGVLIFGGFYISFTKTYEAKADLAKAKVEETRKAKARQDVLNREAAIKNAVVAQETRKKEKEARDLAEEAKKTAQQEADDRRQRAYDERNKLREQVTRLKKDLDEVKAVIAKVTDEKKRYTDEETFLKTYVKQAESNVKYYYDLLDKITVAEKAAADAAAAAAAAAKKG
jgi:predicted ATP-dependent endonuclease of OLD family